MAAPPDGAFRQIPHRLRRRAPPRRPRWRSAQAALPRPGRARRPGAARTAQPPHGVRRPEGDGAVLRRDVHAEPVRRDVRCGGTRISPSPSAQAPASPPSAALGNGPEEADPGAVGASVGFRSPVRLAAAPGYGRPLPGGHHYGALPPPLPCPFSCGGPVPALPAPGAHRGPRGIARFPMPA
ncbi:hypothetical protein SAM23877_7029 [Streptomyces ambofaciens ATCC 23877]|uniref:Uncharacterized protein n=1 Tax=Streptomyces ambofaciens (strain ATCC 23877 / 3486 / DSM 40053 / JCM 4204 / NBRC 12836 / NRRL B-2516) TaxID=278992 RepID=A0A0K2B478_STRA7|nr:hypothetical protein SAM23877_7029 [Streptomyces ambofaciens ATCC 23877]